MAKRASVEISEFSVTVGWPIKPATGGEAILDASIGRLGIVVAGTTVTAYRSDKGDTGDEISLPLYGIAEWLASNWWPLQFEPRKSDDAEDDPDFRSRHWLGFARDGFALPDLWFFPAGDKLEISARDSYLRFARVTFPNKIDASVALDVATGQLGTFVEEVLSRLSSLGFSDTEAHSAWDMVRHTTPDEERYCRLVGALGLSPYDEHRDVDEILIGLERTLSDQVIFDLCQASTPEAFGRTSLAATQLYSAISDAPHIDLQQLAEAGLPVDHSAQAYRWGLDDADRARERLGISHIDPEGGAKFLSELGVDPAGAIAGEEDSAAGQVTAGVRREDSKAQFAVLNGPEAQRRFAAARSVFVGWAAGNRATRLVTTAKTREQQASRSFAAEMLAPIGYIKRKAPGLISTFGIDRLAAELGVSSAVVRYQAQNNGIHVANYMS